MKVSFGILTLILLLAVTSSAWESGQYTWSAPWSWTGPLASSKLGLSIASGGDLDGDGITDMVFAAPYDSSGGLELGTIFIVFGSETGWQPELLISTNSDASFLGEFDRDHPGGADEGGSDGLAIVESVNGDVYDDLVVVSPGNDEAGVNFGKVYLLFGKNSGWAHNEPLSAADVHFMGEGMMGSASVAAAGDVNGDGKGDFLVGAPFFGSGKVYLILGKDIWPTEPISLSKADASFIGELDQTGQSRAGTAVSGIPDINDDGCDEILIGAPKYTPDLSGLFTGKGYVFLGKETGWSTNVSLADADYFITGEEAEDYVGSCVSGAGDVDNDGRGDFLISARNGSGNVYLYLGSSVISSGSNMPLSNADTHILGANLSTGDALDVLGDVDGDGYDDVGIGAPYYDAGPGKAYAIFGRETWPPSLAIENSEGGWRGMEGKFWAGCSIAGGDVNDDGLPDILIGAGADPHAAYDAGTVFIVPSNYGADTVSPARTTDLLAEYDEFGRATLTWSQVTQDTLGGPEAMLFYRMLHYRHQLIDEPRTFVSYLPAVIDPLTTVSDTADVIGDLENFHYYRLFAVDESGNLSTFSTGTGVYDYDNNIPED